MFIKIECLGQPDNIQINLKEIYKGCGIIFTDKDSVDIFRDNEFYVPTKAEVKKAENIFINEYKYYLEQKFKETSSKFEISDEDKNDWIETIENTDPSNDYKKYNRQYAGFYNDSGQKLLVIHLLNFGKRNFKEYFSNWKNKFELGHGDFYEENSRLIFVNLETSKVVDF